MIQVHVVSRGNAGPYASVLEKYHRHRHLIYVEERGWADLRKDDGLERDQFDTPDAVHLIAMSSGEVVGGSRLIPMSQPTLLSEVFPHLVERGAVPRESHSIDWTRMFVVPAHRLGRRPRSVAGALFCGVMEYCLAVGATRVGGIMETFWLPRWQEFGWTTRPLGLPQNIAGSMTLAAFIDVSEQALANVRAATGWHESVLTWSEAPESEAPREVA
jgi:acyl-homoserine lactone synthase